MDADANADAGGGGGGGVYSAIALPGLRPGELKMVGFN